MKQDFVIATFNVFGRTLQVKGTGGRHHNGNRHAMVLIGDAIRPSVIGGVERVDPSDPDVRFATLSGRFEFLFNRGRPAQRFP